MSIIFTMSRVSAQTYERLVNGESAWESTADSVSLGKSWAVLFRFLNAGEDAANPKRLALAVSGGEHLDAYGDYGGPRLLAPWLVKDIVYDLDGGDAPDGYREPFDEEDIRRLYPLVDQTGAYGSVDSVETVVWAFRQVDVFYRAAAAAGDAVIIHWD